MGRAAEVVAPSSSIRTDGGCPVAQVNDLSRSLTARRGGRKASIQITPPRGAATIAEYFLQLQVRIISTCVKYLTHRGGSTCE